MIRETKPQPNVVVRLTLICIIIGTWLYPVKQFGHRLKKVVYRHTNLNHNSKEVRLIFFSPRRCKLRNKEEKLHNKLVFVK